MQDLMDGKDNRPSQACDDAEETARKAEFFRQAYQGWSPWDIGRPQPAFVELEGQGLIQGAVLDVGCGTGENALFMAGKGHDTWGIDIVAEAIEAAREKARQRGLQAEFKVWSALQLAGLGRTFGTVIDSGLFHTFSDDERLCFVSHLAAVLEPGGRYCMLCFSDRQPPGPGPRRITRQEIYDSFQYGWKVSEIRAVNFVSRPAPLGHGDILGWLAVVERV